MTVQRQPRRPEPPILRGNRDRPQGSCKVPVGPEEARAEATPTKNAVKARRPGERMARKRRPFWQELLCPAACRPSPAYPISPTQSASGRQGASLIKEALGTRLKGGSNGGPSGGSLTRPGGRQGHLSSRGRRVRSRWRIGGCLPHVGRTNNLKAVRTQNLTRAVGLQVIQERNYLGKGTTERDLATRE